MRKKSRGGNHSVVKVLKKMNCHNHQVVRLNKKRQNLKLVVVVVVVVVVVAVVVVVVVVVVVSLSHPFVFSMVLDDTIINKIPTYFHKTIYFK